MHTVVFTKITPDFQNSRRCIFLGEFPALLRKGDEISIALNRPLEKIIYTSCCLNPVYQEIEISSTDSDNHYETIPIGQVSKRINEQQA